MDGAGAIHPCLKDVGGRRCGRGPDGYCFQWLDRSNHGALARPAVTLIQRRRNCTQRLHEKLHEKVNISRSLRDMVDRPYSLLQDAGCMDRVPCMSAVSL